MKRRVKPLGAAPQALPDAGATSIPERAAEHSATQPERRFDPQAWVQARGWQAFGFQREIWQHIQAGSSGLLHATTGAGKTYAVWLGALAAFATRTPRPIPSSRPTPTPTPASAPLTVLWLTPMRALAADTVKALATPLQEAGLNWSIGLRTADTSSAERARQSRRLPSVLVTTPESLALLMTRADARAQFASIRLLVIDEWHEMLGNKRGVQAQLGIARLAHWQPQLQVWGLSATLGNLQIAQDALLTSVLTKRVTVRGIEPKTLTIDTLIPETIERFPWGGHLGMRQIKPVAEQIDPVTSALVFTNTRAQAELWYRGLLEARPDWAGSIALHHGSLDAEVRAWVEQGLKDGLLKAVVCTSSLDLGVDFLPVERVFQVGSPKGVARLLQRAGRSGHAPGRPSRVTLVPTHAFELVEAAAARWAIERQMIEAREPPDKPLDVLVQHLVTVALGGGFEPAAMLAEIRSAWSYRHLSDLEFDWALSFVESGGVSLAAYPDFHRLQRDADGVYHMPRADLARRHRSNVGTIVSSASMQVAYVTGGRIGSIEESFVSRLRPGDVFTFAGRSLELVRVHEMTAQVRRSTKSRGVVPAWQGGRMPLSSELAAATLEMLSLAGDALEAKPHLVAKLPATQPAKLQAELQAKLPPELQAVLPLLAVQQGWSAIPKPGTLLVELLQTREGHHMFCYPFAGRMAHVGLGSLLAWRAARTMPSTFSVAMNDYGFELLSSQAFDWQALIEAGLFDPIGLEHDLLASLNSSELALRRFREIARIAGLVFQGHPGQAKSARQLQASSGLFYEVFRKHDSGNLLLLQAQSEVMRQELEVERLADALARMRDSTLHLTRPRKPTPLAFPLIIGRMRERISTEKLADRIARMLAELERAADAAPERTQRTARRRA